MIGSPAPAVVPSTGGVPPLWIGAAAVALLLAVVALRGRRSSDAAASRAAHEAAREREPPVDLGETHRLGVTEITDHHSGARVAVGKVEGFVIFVEGLPEDVGPGDVVRATVTSFNEGRTSADATFEGRA